MRRIIIVLATALLVSACSGAATGGGLDTPPTGTTPGSGEDAGSGSDQADGGQSQPSPSNGDASTPPTKGNDSGAPSHGGTDSGTTTPPASSDGGQATRNGTCTPLSQQNGTAVDTNHGRLDGTLVYVLPIDGSSSCNGDSAHVHLQIEVSGSVYDVAVDVGKSGDAVSWYEQTLAIPGGTWSEGWHGSDSLGYTSLGLSSSAFTTLTPAAMGTEVESLLASTSKISIFCTGYTPGDNGCHDVHYQDGTSQDGAIVLDPTSATSPVVFFRFESDSF